MSWLKGSEGPRIATMRAMLRFPAPLTPGDRIGVTSPTSGVSGPAADRIDCIARLRQAGYDVVVGDMMDGQGVTSGPPNKAPPS